MTDAAQRAAETLKEHRQSIDRLDAILVYTLAERFKQTQAVGRLKAEHNLPPIRPRRARRGRSNGWSRWPRRPIWTPIRQEIPDLHHQRSHQASRETAEITHDGAGRAPDEPKEKTIMAMKIRLARGGSKKRPHYSIVATDSRMPRDGRFLEKLGTYNPLLAKDDENRVKMDLDRVKHWLGQGAQPTDRIARMLEAAGVMPKKARSNLKSAVPGKQMAERAAKKAAARRSPCGRIRLLSGGCLLRPPLFFLRG
jgi:small subunit ribosomal protein S16